MRSRWLRGPEVAAWWLSGTCTCGWVGSFLGILIHSVLFGKDRHNLLWRLKESLQCSIVKYLINWLPPISVSIPALAGAPGSARAVIIRSAAMAEMGNAIPALQLEGKQASRVALQNRMALNDVLVTQERSMDTSRHHMLYRCRPRAETRNVR